MELAHYRVATIFLLGGLKGLLQNVAPSEMANKFVVANGSLQMGATGKGDGSCSCNPCLLHIQTFSI